MKYHKTKDGKKIKLCNLEDQHLLNIISYIKRKSREGLMIQIGGGTTTDDMWYDQYKIYGKDVKKHLHYKAYKKELKRRCNGK